MSTADVAAPDLGPQEAEERESIWHRAITNVKSGNLGVLPVVLGEILIVTYFGFTATNFFTAGNFVNVILQMAGVTMIAYGVVFVLLLGEIDLSIGYLSGIAAVTAATMQLEEQGGEGSIRGVHLHQQEVADMAVLNVVKKMSGSIIGPQQMTEATQEVEFTFPAPEARKVCIAGKFNAWDTGSTPMKKGKDGTWRIKLKLPPGTYEYRYFVDGAWASDQ